MRPPVLAFHDFWRVAVRMSMGVPGLVEPYRYQRHVYCDGGMCNDFPMNALPDDGHRLGLMVPPARLEPAAPGLDRRFRPPSAL